MLRSEEIVYSPWPEWSNSTPRQDDTWLFRFSTKELGTPGVDEYLYMLEWPLINPTARKSMVGWNEMSNTCSPQLISSGGGIPSSACIVVTVLGMLVGLQIFLLDFDFWLQFELDKLCVASFWPLVVAGEWRGQRERKEKRERREA